MSMIDGPKRFTGRRFLSERYRSVTAWARGWYVGEIAKSDVEVLCGLYGLLRHANAKPYLPRIEAPVLGLYPTAGALTSSEQEGLLQERIRNFRLIHLLTSSHAVLTLEAEACTRHLIEFIKASSTPH
jgi:pimeloyl-ACP methyl ester carboxylesterase